MPGPYFAILIITTRARHFRGVFVCRFAAVGVGPQVADLVRTLDPDVAPFGGHLGSGRTAVE